jgi:hypothetical protein
MRRRGRAVERLGQSRLNPGAAHVAALVGKIPRLRALPLPGMRPSAAHVPRTASPKPVPVSAGEQRPVPRRVKDFIDISEFTSLDDLIRYLETIRDNLPPDHQAEMKIRGDEIFGHRLTISYFREQTPEELELESKYGGETDGAGIEQLRRKLDDIPYKLGKANNG